jgi:hypothetical protein
MKNIILIISIFCFQFNVNAQNNVTSADDANRIALNTFVSDKIGNLTDEAKNVLVTKLNEITTKNGIGGNALNPRFIITPNVIEITKDISATQPVIYQYELQVTFYIGDGIEGTKFSSLSISLKGNGKSETKAYITALKAINTSDARFAKFIDEGKSKIIEYYNSKCDFIIKDAQTAAGQNDFDGAIYKLMSVPDVCKDCYSKCMNAVPVVFHQKLEHDCQVLIARAKTLIAQNQYDQAAETLSSILPDISCYPTADQMMRDINDHRCSVALGAATAAWAAKNVNATSNALSSISADSKCSADANRIAEEVRAYVRQQENREWQFKLLDHNDRVDLTKMTIKAARAVGVAYASRRTKVVYNTTIISRW